MYSAAGECDKLSTHPCRPFSLAEIHSATIDFDDELVIGQGGFGKVYKGHIYSEEGGHVVAIKRLDSMSSQGELEFRAEINTLSKLRHCHLVPLIGYCDDNDEKILVYEYMSNGTLYHHIHKAKTPLNWVQRIKIAIGAGRGLDYLHTGVGTRHGIIHRDVKSSNILLDENWEALISDFGLSKIGPTNQSSSYVDSSIKGTFGYLDPEYFYTSRLTRKTDVFAFGVLLFELLSGRLPVDIRYGEEQCSLVRWAQKCVKQQKIDQIVDSNIRGTIYPKCLRRFANIAYHCLLSVPKERPTMTVVVASLQAMLELQVKCDVSAISPGIMIFTWKIHKYLASMIKQEYEQSSTSPSKKLENNMNQCSSTNTNGRDHGGMVYQHGELMTRDVKMFTHTELKLATRNFSNDAHLDVDGYVKAYKGWVDHVTYPHCKDNTGLSIVVKRLHPYNPVTLEKFDLDVLQEFHHPNLVKLIGYCLKDEELFIVHEFMHNGNFDDQLCRGVIARLPMVTKVKIAVGIARGIVYLNKIQNKSGDCLDRQRIFLDEDFTAKLSDYDITKSGFYPAKTRNDYDLVVGDYYPGMQPFRRQFNLSGFRMVFAEVVIGRHVNNESEFEKINRFRPQHTKRSFHSIAELCLQICKEVDAETKILKILEKHDKYNRWSY